LNHVEYYVKLNKCHNLYTEQKQNLKKLLECNDITNDVYLIKLKEIKENHNREKLIYKNNYKQYQEIYKNLKEHKLNKQNELVKIYDELIYHKAEKIYEQNLKKIILLENNYNDNDILSEEFNNKLLELKNNISNNERNETINFTYNNLKNSIENKIKEMDSNEENIYKKVEFKYLEQLSMKEIYDLKRSNKVYMDPEPQQS
jgi:hypothetical protein